MVHHKSAINEQTDKHALLIERIAQRYDETRRVSVSYTSYIHPHLAPHAFLSLHPCRVPCFPAFKLVAIITRPNASSGPGVRFYLENDLTTLVKRWRNTTEKMNTTDRANTITGSL